MLVKSKLKYIQSLGQKKFRDANALYIAEGPKIVGELLEEIPGQFEGIYALREWIEGQGILAGNVQVTEISDIELSRISQLQTPNSVLAVIRQEKHKPANFDPSRLVTLALDDIQDPGNLGTIVRIADWFGVKNIICSNSTADVYNPKVVQSAMGSIARVNVWYDDLIEVLAGSKGVKVYAAILNGTDLGKFEKISSGIIVIGNESKGISDEVLKLVTDRVTIPGKGKAESLNAAVATGIILSHLT